MSDLKAKLAAAIERAERRVSEARYTGPRSKRGPYDDHRKAVWAAQADAALRVVQWYRAKSEREA